MKSIWDGFMGAVEKVVNIIAPFIKSRKGKPLQIEIAKKILQLEEKQHPAIDFILSHPGMKKTPLYFLHRKELNRKYRLRKQDFLVLVEYLQNKPEPEPEPEPETKPLFFRSSRTHAYKSSKTGLIELRIWKYHTQEITERELDEEWSSAVAKAIMISNGILISQLEEWVADELNEEVDEDEGDEWGMWLGILWFGGYAYSLDGWRVPSLDGQAV